LGAIFCFLLACDVSKQNDCSKLSKMFERLRLQGRLFALEIAVQTNNVAAPASSSSPPTVLHRVEQWSSGGEESETARGAQGSHLWACSIGFSLPFALGHTLGGAPC